jgi:hypothetical protein
MTGGVQVDYALVSLNWRFATVSHRRHRRGDEPGQ